MLRLKGSCPFTRSNCIMPGMAAAASRSPLAMPASWTGEDCAGDDAEGVAGTEKALDDMLAKVRGNFEEGKWKGEEPAEEILPGQGAMVQQLRAALVSGDVESRSALGQKFSAWLASDEGTDGREEYNGLKGKQGATAAKKAFRLKWATKEMAKRVILRKSTHEQLEETVGHKGIYMTIGRTVVAEGGLGNPHAWRRALNYVESCISSGPPFVEYNQRKKESEILYFEKIKNDIFSTKYGLDRIEEHVEGGPEQSSGEPSRSSVPALAEPPQLGTPQKAGAGGGRAKAKAKPAVKAGRKRSPGKPEGEEDPSTDPKNNGGIS